MKIAKLVRVGLVIAILGLAPLALARLAQAERPLVYTILPGDTLPSLAARFGVPMDSLLRAHGLGLHDTLYAGDTLLLPATPGGGRRNIAPGETLEGIAARYGVAPLQLAWRNGLVNPRRLIAGETLVIPEISAPWDLGAAIARPLAGQRAQGALAVSGWGQSHDNELLVQLHAADGTLLAERGAAIHAEIGQVGAFAAALELPDVLERGQALTVTVSRRDRHTGALVALDGVSLTAP